MGRRAAVGVMNGNWRAGHYYQYRMAVEAGKRGVPTAAEIQRMTTKKKMRSSYWTQRMCNAVDALRSIDPTGWEAWYDNDYNVPAQCTDREIAQIVELRVKQLNATYTQPKARVRSGIFIWTDEIGPYVYCKEVGKTTLYIQPFETFNEAVAFVEGIPFESRGYGVVLDILPVSALV